MTELNELRPLSDSQRETLEEAVSSYEVALGEDVAAVRYLLDRGISESSAVTSRLGVVKTEEFGHWVGRLAIPYLDQHGKPVTIRFRCLANHKCKDVGCPKYLPITGDPSRVFNIGGIHRAGDEIHVTEGELDTVMLTQLGLNAVAIPGASGFQGHHRRMLAGFSRTWVWGDPDQAGQQFINKVCQMLRSAKGVRLRDGDVTETYQRGGASAIYDLIEGDGR